MDNDATPPSSDAGPEADEGLTSNLQLSIQLLDQIDRAKQLDELLDRTVEDTLDLLPSQVRALQAMRSGADTIGALTADLGLVDGAAEPIIESLVDRACAVASPAGSLSLTERGSAMLDQAEGLRFRIADLVSTRLSERQLQKLGEGFRGLSSARQLPRV